MSGTTLLNIIETIETLEQVRDRILNIQSISTIRNVPEEQLQHLEQNDREFLSMWRRAGDISTEILNFTLPNQEPIRYLVREAYVETSRRRSNMFDENGQILPKEQRTIIEIVQTIFFELNNRVYSVLMTSSVTSINKVKKLFGDYLKELDNDEEINIADYKIDPDLFYWLFYKHEKNNGLIEARFEVSSIAGFIGNIADESHTVTGNSDVTPSLLVTKAFVSKYHPFKSLDVLLKYHNYKFNFIFNDSSECFIRSSCSIPNLRIDKKIASVLIIYGFIIPRLFTLFNDDEIWDEEGTTTEFAKEVGIQVIREIADFHGLAIEDIIEN
ncbi:hypothetical protein DTX80_11785 [Bacilli bacterium]|nr:hypothetical protein WH51_13335 [Bacilli bacterium VT-13-104]PZD84855.1 hypothetical protein DEJ64_10990 [Bacilli bacterium]PZD86374.1 hypothetical protein DEJ60_10815 [Bacilli bacterium]PZD89836.1 hypothetical protein DEJ66_11045 [Bacilli bacterium]RCO05346.1 hypothetical protein DTX80_11785 [Bacilli bacterium]